MESARGFFWTIQSVFGIWIRLTILTTVMDWKGLLKAGSVMEWKGCHFENCRLALGVVFCRVNPLGFHARSGRVYLRTHVVNCTLNFEDFFCTCPINILRVQQNNKKVVICQPREAHHIFDHDHHWVTAHPRYTKEYEIYAANYFLVIMLAKLNSLGEF